MKDAARSFGCLAVLMAMIVAAVAVPILVDYVNH